MEHSLKQEFFQLINDCLNHQPNNWNESITVSHSKRSVSSHSFPGGFPKKFRDVRELEALEAGSHEKKPDLPS